MSPSKSVSEMTEEEWEDFYFYEIMGEKPKIKRTFRKSKEEIKPKLSIWQRFKNFFKR